MSLRSAIQIAATRAARLVNRPIEEKLPPRLQDHVLYGACRRCGWRANIQGVGMSSRCPDCGYGLTVLGGNISEVAARLDQFLDGSHSGDRDS